MLETSVIESKGPSLSLGRRLLRPLADEEILIKVEAAGINHADLLQHQGKYPPPPQASDILGLEVAGTVEAIGARATRFSVGDKVMALVEGGGYARYCIAHQALSLPIPPNLSFIQAAALPEGCFTLWNSLFKRSFLKKGDTLLIHGGSSGIGTLAIQVAKIFGVKVAVTVKNTFKAQACKELGAEKSIIYPEEDFVKSILEWTYQQGVNVILDCVGGEYLPRNIISLSFGGRLVQIACQSGRKGTLDLIALMKKQILLTGCTLRDRPLEEKREIAEAVSLFLLPKISQGLILPHIYAKVSFQDVNKAHKILASQVHVGKVVLSLEDV